MPGRSLQFGEAKIPNATSGPLYAAVHTLSRCRNNYRQLSPWPPSATGCKTRFTPSSEFFSRTLAYTSTNLPSTVKERRDSCASRILIEQSGLLRAHLQHACLVLCRKSVEFHMYTFALIKGRTRGERALNWLASFKSLKTLEVVFDLSDLDQGRAAIYRETEAALVESACRRLTQTLPRLEKVVTRWYMRPGSITEETADLILEHIPQLVVHEKLLKRLASAS
ncbi:hypothetical protein SMACR_01778 [Sordaria macrospora]|uniref:WGS project CABT00000000 data, contig 2.5 n=2 Tax=Sordaria macrospora TaxID=5147 RepID=F7VRU4_SORMK|nr:uncharacterized protein SMAC_01778 [Sordaria macrospora k-hell]KAA8636473.1 hypothetical protein SMACR_01778 [Sordaria macrospora]WPJ61469.1 hypothetical protein SMAC4_01778 [Sordaria macrospora]CCC08230.1 unnamed protein product [Sordaria macrospora k-hell]